MREYKFRIGKDDSVLLDKLDELKEEGIGRYLVTNKDLGLIIIRTEEPSEVGSKLIDNHGAEWLVVSYQGDMLRAINVTYNYLSEAEGSNLEELVSEIHAIEEITIEGATLGKS